MSNLLAHLASRSLDTEPVIRPRLAARFEPVSKVQGLTVPTPMPWSLEQAIEAAESEQTESYDRPARPEWPAPRETDPAPIRPAPATRRPARATNIKNTAHAGDELDTSDPNLPTRVERETEKTTSQPRTHRASESDPDDMGQAESVHANKPAQMESTTRAPVQPRTVIAPPTQAEPSIYPAPARRPAEPIRPVIARAEMDRNGERATYRKTQAKALEEETHEPEIHITIGRIEVRAVSGAQSSRATTAPAGPRVSLEDYLKARNGGGG